MLLEVQPIAARAPAVRKQSPVPVPVEPRAEAPIERQATASLAAACSAEPSFASVTLASSPHEANFATKPSATSRVHPEPAEALRMTARLAASCMSDQGVVFIESAINQLLRFLQVVTAVKVNASQTVLEATAASTSLR